MTKLGIQWPEQLFLPTAIRKSEILPEEQVDAGSEKKEQGVFLMTSPCPSERGSWKYSFPVGQKQ